MLSFSDVTFVLFCFVTSVCVLFRFRFFLFFVSLEMSLFPSIFVPLPFSLCMQSSAEPKAVARGCHLE